MQRPNEFTINTEVADPSFAAMMVTLGFPFTAAPRETVLVDLQSRTDARGGSMAWRFGNESTTRPGLQASHVRESWGAPHGVPRADERIDDVRLCKRALHNYRVLLTMLHHNGGLHCGRYGAGYRLSSWPSAAYESVPLVQPHEVPLGAIESDRAERIAVAVTLGVPVQSCVWGLGRVVWQLGVPAPECPWSAAELLAIADDEDYMRKYEDPPAVLHALFFNRRKLVENATRAQSRLLVLSKRGRYAVVSEAADGGRIDEALRHLNT